jgi:hypothetical protein
MTFYLGRDPRGVVRGSHNRMTGMVASAHQCFRRGSRGLNHANDWAQILRSQYTNDN